MNIKDIFQLSLAIWGAVLSTVLGYMKISENKRSIRVFFDYLAFKDLSQVIIVNVGHRPITIVDAGVKILPKLDNFQEIQTIRDNQNRSDHLQFPKVLGDGESLIIALDENIRDFLQNRANYLLTPFARDAEGKEYICNKMRVLNTQTNIYKGTIKL